MPGSLIVILYTIREISKFLGWLLVDENDDNKNKKSQLNAGIASPHSELMKFCIIQAYTGGSRESLGDPPPPTP